MILSMQFRQLKKPTMEKILLSTTWQKDLIYQPKQKMETEKERDQLENKALFQSSISAHNPKENVYNASWPVDWEICWLDWIACY